MRTVARTLMLLVVAVGAPPLFAGDSRKDGEIIVIRPDASVGSKQGLPVFEGISGQNAGAQGISMNRVIIPPGGAARAHLHKGYESVIYLIKGRVKTLYGEGLKKSVINEGGDFIYIPAGVPHKPINLSDTLAAEAIVARTDPNEQESVQHVAEPEHQ